MYFRSRPQKDVPTLRLPTVEWLHNKQLVIFTASNSPSRDAIDPLMDKMLANINKWSLAKPYLIMLDMSQAPFTTYSSKRFQEVYQLLSPHKTGRLAIVLPSTTLNRVMHIFIERISRGRFPKLEMRYFFSREEGLKWLEAALRHEPSPKKQEP